MSKTDQTPQTTDELRKELAESQRAHKMGELKNTARLTQLRRAIARNLTAERQQSEKKEEEK
jgi:ribosomal protein L29